MTSLGELSLEKAAEQAAGNWRNFDCFVWFRKDELDEPDAWAVIYHSHRDSGLLDQSNAAAIESAMEPFTEGDEPDVVMESHSHWAVGHVDGFSVRVFRNGEITEAFRKYHELAESLADYPILNESDYSERELEATLENIGEASWRLKDDFDLPDGWNSAVFDWFSENNENAIENTDDQGGWPNESDLEMAFESLGFQRVA